MADKKSRNPNYTPDEKITLLTIVSKYKNIIENKKTDYVTWKEKDETWKKIFSDFNSISPTGIFRSADTLRRLYDNIKKKTRKTAAEEKRAVKKTGGGNDPVKTDGTYDLALSIINSKSVFGLQNTFDSDGAHSTGEEIINVENNFSNEIEISDELQNYINTNEIVTENVNWAKWKPANLQSPMSSKLELSLSRRSEDAEIKEKSSSQSLLDPKPTDLQSPVSSKLQLPSSLISENAEIKEQSKSQLLDPKPWLKRRRPPIIEQKSDLSDIYKEVGETKLKYFKALLDNLHKQQEREEKEHQQKIEEYELRKQSLLLDIRIKEQELQKKL